MYAWYLDMCKLCQVSTSRQDEISYYYYVHFVALMYIVMRIMDEELVVFVDFLVGFFYRSLFIDESYYYDKILCSDSQNFGFKMNFCH